MKHTVVLVTLAATLAAPGCGSVLFSPYQEVRPACTNVPGAGFSAPAVGAGCRSGQVMRLDRRQDHAITVNADGYEPRTINLVSEVSVLRATVSIILNGILATPTLWIATPFMCAADIKAGAWQVLEPGDVVVDLYRPGEGPPAEAGPSAAWPAANPTPSGFCSACGAKTGASNFCTSCGARVRR